jgi:hypothetical protein
MSTRYRADEYAAIAQHLKELEAEKTARINGISLEDAKPVEAPEDIDWNGMYGYPAGWFNIKTSFSNAPTNRELFAEWSAAYKKTES